MRITVLTPTIDWQLCQICNPCQASAVCKTQAIVQIDPDSPPIIEPTRCNGCGSCIAACEHSAISSYQIS